jgi:hypothetical protein
MGIGAGVFLAAVGAILTYAIDRDSAEGVNLDTVGIILMIAGAVVVLLSMLVFESWRAAPRRRIPPEY